MARVTDESSTKHLVLGEEDRVSWKGKGCKGKRYRADNQIKRCSVKRGDGWVVQKMGAASQGVPHNQSPFQKIRSKNVLCKLRVESHEGQYSHPRTVGSAPLCWCS